VATIVEKKYLEKFFRLYSKCSKLYSDLIGLEEYLVISYYKAEDNYIYPYQYIDFDFWFCHRSGEKDVSNNKYLTAEFNCKKIQFMVDMFKDSYFDEITILNSLSKKIKDCFKDDLNRTDIVCLNNIYRDGLSKI